MAKQHRASNMRPRLRGIEGGRKDKSPIRRAFEARRSTDDVELNLPIVTVLSVEDEAYVEGIAELLQKRG